MATTQSTGDYRAGIVQAKTAGPSAPTVDPAVSNFLQLLARAARQFHTYPATSPLCVEAVDACHRAFRACDLPPAFVIHVSPSELLVDGHAIGRGSVVEQELARPLHRARVASIEIDQTVSPRDWSRFCSDLLRIQKLSNTKTTLAELLAEGGVAAIMPRSAPRPEVLEIAVPSTPVRGLIERERQRQASATGTGPVQYFYPPEKGWVRLDPTVGFDSVSLMDLAVLVDDPVQLASILTRLTDDDSDGAAASAALEQKYGDVVTLFSALDPRLARVLFAKLARAVLGLDAGKRRALLRRTILPGLLDGRADGEAVLSQFPDVELAEALCLLLDLETAAPEVLTAALDRLALPAERRDSVVPLLEAKLKSGQSARKEDPGSNALDSYADKLIKIDSASGKSFAEFAAFDLSMTDQTRAALGTIRDRIAASDPVDAQLGTLLNLVRIEPNPALVTVFVDRATSLIGRQLGERRWNDAAVWIQRFHDLSEALRDARPDVMEAIRASLTRMVDRDFVVGLAALCETDGGTHQAGSIVASLGAAVAAAWAGALDRASDQARLRPLLAIMTEHVSQVAPSLAARIGSGSTAAARAIVVVLGAGGPRYESVIADQLARGDERLGREALRALAQMGTPHAAEVVVNQLQSDTPWMRAAAEEALWRFPSATAVAIARDLLGRRDFVVHDPQLAIRLMERAAQAGKNGLEGVLAKLTPLRFRFWNVDLVRVASKAQELLR